MINILRVTYFAASLTMHGRKVATSDMRHIRYMMSALLPASARLSKR